jgi:hypothetical protein
MCERCDAMDRIHPEARSLIENPPSRAEHCFCQHEIEHFWKCCEGLWGSGA